MRTGGSKKATGQLIDLRRRIRGKENTPDCSRIYWFSNRREERRGEFAAIGNTHISAGWQMVPWWVPSAHGLCCPERGRAQ